MKVAVLITPLARGAYFSDTVDVARHELEALTGIRDPEHRTEGSLDFLQFEVDDPGPLFTLSFTQGVFEVCAGGLQPLDTNAPFRLHDDWVFGTKYPGKTHELVTQLAINLAQQFSTSGGKKLLDPMAGRGTTLLWALRYGFDARGIELDASALDDLHRHIKRQAKLKRIKHQHRAGSVGEKREDGHGRFVLYELNGTTLQLIAGDTIEMETLVGKARFDMVVCDLPYGVRFKGRGGRSPFDTVSAASKAWADRLRPGGAMVIVHNRYQPKPDELRAGFESGGLEQLVFSSPLRMRESSVRERG
ncbi:MAG: hypothetical protein AAFQ82_02820, partial [Myxococcota bacterium]